MGRLANLIEAQREPAEARALAGVFVASDASIQKLMKALAGLAKRLDAVEGRISSRVDGIEIPPAPDLSGDFAALKQEVQGVLQAVQAIRIPEQAPFPQIPVPERVDLEPLFSKLNQLETLMDRDPPAIAEQRAGGREWEFEVIRNNYGVIDKVIAKEI